MNAYQAAWMYLRSEQAAHPPRPESDLYIKFLLQLIFPGLPAPVRELAMRGHIAVGEVGTTAANAYCERVATDDYAVVFSSGLRMLVYRISRAVAAALLPDPDNETESLSVPELTRIIIEVLWWYENTERAGGPEYKITTSQVAFGTRLATYAAAFFLGHEFGHIFADRSMDWRMLGTEAINEAEEYLADSVGISSLVETFRLSQNSDFAEIRVAYAGAHLGLCIWHVQDVLGMLHSSRTHPTTSIRLDRLRGVLREHCASDAEFADLTALADEIDRVFSQVFEVLANIHDHEETLIRPAQQMVEEFLQLLDACIDEDLRTDRARFLKEAPRLLSGGYPHIVLNQVFVPIVHAFVDSARDAPLGTPHEWSETDRLRARRRLLQTQAFDLLYALTNRLPEPASALYKTALLETMKGLMRPPT
jgi:hypothetical protein